MNAARVSLIGTAVYRFRSFLLPRFATTPTIIVAFLVCLDHSSCLRPTSPFFPNNDTTLGHKLSHAISL